MASSSSSPIKTQGNEYSSEMQIDGNSHFRNPDVPKCVENLRKNLKLKIPLQVPRQQKWSPPESRVSLTLDQAIEHELKHGRKLKPNISMKTLRRTISNRLSAQRSRKKRVELIDELVKKLQDLEVLTSTLRPQIEQYRENKRMLEEDKVFLKAAVDARTAESIHNEYKIEERRRELQILRQCLNNNGGLSSNQIPQLIQDPADRGQSSNQLIEDPAPAPAPAPAAAEEYESNPKPAPYSLEFYEQRLMQMEMNELLQAPTSPSLAPTAPLIQLRLDDDGVDDVEVDQYLNFDEEVD